MPLRILHLSDIHFQSGYAWDPDGDLRSEVVRDVRALVESGGQLDAVLIGGDIAFSAHPDEYAVATAWIGEVLEAAGNLMSSRVWTVPGNHDVSRSVLNASGDAQRFREAMRACEVSAIDHELRERIAKDPAAAGLMLPLAEYNRFAEQFLCTTRAGSLAWRDTSLSIDGWTVSLTGINSVMNSDSTDSKATLVVGTHQCQLPRAIDTVHIAMLHHPPSWVRDWKTIEPYLNRAHLALFGHEHAFEATQRVPHGTVSVSAGAVAPERDEHGEIEPFVPTFNLISLSRTDDDRLKVEIRTRYWSISGTRFDEHPGGTSTFFVDLDPALSDDGASNVLDIPGVGEVIASSSPLISNAEDLAVGKPQEDPGSRQSLRAIGVQYLALPVFRRLDIARALGVIQDDDVQLPPAELYPLILRRVRDAELVEDLVMEMTR